MNLATVDRALMQQVRRSSTQEILRSVALASGLNSGVEAMLTRVDEFPSPLVALLSGIAAVPEAREFVDTRVSERWARRWSVNSDPYDEVVIGSGPHALIYATIRAAKGVRVVVLEKNDTVGGAFASGGAGFWLNSRNRPGDLGLPGEQVGLNVLPGCVLQPAFVGGGEYQTNSDLAWTIRMNFALSGAIAVHTGVEVTDVEAQGNGLILLKVEGTVSRSEVRARRVVFATGLGDPKALSNEENERVLTFNQFMERMGGLFPLQGMKRVAVIGAGDSGKTVVEALLGQGPTTGMSVAGLDFPSQIDWYGLPYDSQRAWCEANRGRYNRIGKAIGNRVKQMPKLIVAPSAGYDSVLLGLKSYDWVINCCGFLGSTALTRRRGLEDAVRVGANFVGRKSEEVYTIGPAAQLTLSALDQQNPALANLPENATSLFRYAPLTASLAATLPVAGALVAADVVADADF